MAPPVTRPRMELPPRYHVLRHVATGGMATVHAATDELLGREVAIGPGFGAPDPRWRLVTTITTRAVRAARKLPMTAIRRRQRVFGAWTSVDSVMGGLAAGRPRDRKLTGRAGIGGRDEDRA